MPYHHVDAHAVEDSIRALEQDGEVVVSVSPDMADPTFVHVVTRDQDGPQHQRVAS